MGRHSLRLRTDQSLRANPAADARPRSYPALWTTFSITAGNLIQACGIIAGAILFVIAAHLGTARITRIVLMIVAYLAIYVCCHAIAHWAVGRLVGIRFRGYGIRGTDHPELYPPGFRQLMSVIPFFTALTEPASMRQANPRAKALMFAAGETSSTVCSLLAALYAWQSSIPGGWILFAFTVVWDITATITTSVTPKGDYAKARKALRSSR